MKTWTPLKILKSTLLLSTLSICALTARAQTKGSVTIDIDPALLASYDDSTRDQVLEVKRHLEEKLFRWDSFPIEAPTSTFNGSEFVPFSDLIISPDSTEVAELGNQRFSESQLDQIKHQALFVIPSQSHPGQNHVWKVSWVLQTGSDQINLNFKELRSIAARQIVVRIPTTFLGRGPFDGPTFYKAIRNVGQGVAQTLDAVLGWRNMTKAYSNEEVSRILTDKFLELNPNASPVDLPELQKAYLPIVGAILQETTNTWAQVEAGRTEFYLKGARQQLSDESEIADIVSSHLERDLHVMFLQNVANSAELNQLRAGLATELSHRFEANFVTQQFESTVRATLEAERVSIGERIRARSPKLSETSSWFNKQVDEEFREFYRAHRMEIYSDLPRILKEKGLQAEGERAELMLGFLSNSLQTHDRELRNARKPLNTLVVPKTHWFSKNWELTQNAEDGRWSGKDTEAQSVTTRWPLWRATVFLLRTKNYYLNSLRYMAVEQFINGPVGLRSLFGDRPFYSGKMVDEETGKIVRDITTVTGTFRYRWKAITAQVLQDAKEAKEKRGRGILSERANDIFSYIRFRMIKQIALKTGLTFGQAAGTVGVTLGTGLAAIPVWSPLVAGLEWTSNLLLWDRDAAKNSERRLAALSPLGQSVLWKFLTVGLGQGVVSTARVGLHSLLGAGLGGLAYGQKWALSSKDFIGRLLLNSSLVHTPSENSWLARRVQGPGLASDYYFQVKPDLAIVALQMTLEDVELALYSAQTERRAVEPMRAGNQALQQLFSPFGISTALNTDGAAFHSQVTESVQNVLTTLKRSVDAQQKFRAGINNLRGDEMSRVRLAQADLDQLTQMAGPVVEKFYNEHLSPLFASEEERANFWKSLRLKAGDFSGLADFYLASTFSNGILDSLESINPSFRIAVPENTRVDSLADKVMDGIRVETIPNVKPIVVDDGSPKVARPADRAEELIRRPELDQRSISSSLTRCEALVSRFFEAKHI